MKKRLLIVLLAVCCAPALAQAPTRPMAVTEFVRQTYFEGVPYGEAKRYDASVVPTLLELLSSSEEEASWANVVTVLSIVADEQGVEAVIDFVRRGSDEMLSEPHYRAKTSAIMSLGYAINKTASPAALDFLKSFVDPSAARAGSMVRWRSPFHEASSERDAQLRKMATLGLALSGNADAAEVLRAIQQPATTEAARVIRASVPDDMLSEALAANAAIAEDGLEEYYKRSEL